MRVLVAAVFLFAVSLNAGAQAVFDEERYHELLKELRCLVCQNQNLFDSGAELAGDLRDIVRERMQAGESDDAIVDYLVSRYGDYIHYKPPVTRSTLLLWFAPALLLLLVLITLLIRRRSTVVSDDLSAADLERARERLTPNKNNNEERQP